MNNENLRPFNKITESEQRDLARQGGIASGESRRRKKAWKDTINSMLVDLDLRKLLGEANTEKMRSVLGDNFTNEEVILLQQIIQAMQGNRQSAEFVRDTSGNKPVDVLEVTETDSESIREMEEYLYGQADS